MSNYSAMLTFSLFAKSKDEVKSQLPNYINSFVIDRKEEYGDLFYFKGALFIAAESENELLEKLKNHRNNDLFKPLPNFTFFTITLNDRVYTDSDPLPVKLAFLKQ